MLRAFLLLILAASATSLFSQSFTAREGYNFALQEAQNAIGGTAKLRAIAIQNNLQASQTITTEFNLETGRSNAFLYAFENENGVEDFVIAIRILGFVDATQFGIDPSPFAQFVPEGTLEDNWIDSEEAAKILTLNSDYLDLSTNSPDAQLDIVALGINEIEEELTIGEPYWHFTFINDQDNDVYICDIHAVNKDVTCFDLLNTSVETQETADFFETANAVQIDFNEKSLIGSTLYAYDISGRIVGEYSTTESTLISKNDLPNGLVFLMATDGVSIFKTAINNTK